MVEKLEQLSVGDALRAIRFAEVVVLVMDATEPLEKQDLQLADLVADEGRALVLALEQMGPASPNQEARLQELQADLEETLTQVRGVPMVPISALSGERARPADAGGARRLRDLEQAVSDGGAEPLAAGGDGAASAARRHRPAHQAQISDAVEDAAADLLSLRARGPKRCRTPIGAIWSTACARISASPACRSG